MEGVTRRSFVRGAAALAVSGLYTGRVSFAEAQARQVRLQVLSPTEAQLFAAVGETLAPGAEAAGIAYFIDQQLAVAPEDAMLLLKYVDVLPPFVDFYRPGARALDAACKAANGVGIFEAHPDQRAALVREISAGDPPGWEGPPAPLLYFVLRSDAIDVVYGTKEGFEKLGVPPMYHIVPPRPWSGLETPR